MLIRPQTVLRLAPAFLPPPLANWPSSKRLRDSASARGGRDGLLRGDADGLAGDRCYLHFGTAGRLCGRSHQAIRARTSRLWPWSRSNVHRSVRTGHARTRSLRGGPARVGSVRPCGSLGPRGTPNALLCESPGICGGVRSGRAEAGGFCAHGSSRLRRGGVRSVVAPCDRLALPLLPAESRFPQAVRGVLFLVKCGGRRRSLTGGSTEADSAGQNPAPMPLRAHAPPRRASVRCVSCTRPPARIRRAGLR